MIHYNKNNCFHNSMVTTHYIISHISTKLTSQENKNPVIIWFVFNKKLSLTGIVLFYIQDNIHYWNCKFIFYIYNSFDLNSCC